MKSTQMLAVLLGTVVMSVSNVAAAAPMQVLLDENFEAVTGITSATALRTIADINTNNPSQLNGSPAPSFANTGNGNASADAFNVRRSDNAIDGTAGTPTLGNTTFDNFFIGTANRFMVIGDNSGNLGGNPNGGTNASASSTMSIRFALEPIALVSPFDLDIFFDYVFDADNTSNSDDFIAELIFADSSKLSLLNLAAPSAVTRGTFNTVIASSALTSAPAFLSFQLKEYTGNGSSAVGLDNIFVSATPIPEPGTWVLLGTGLLGLGRIRRMLS